MSRYRNAAQFLPRDLLEALQRYAAGQSIYVPKTDERVGWGTKSGAREMLDARNESIRHRRREGTSLRQLATEFHLSQESIRKILRERTR